jgi:hypothetical protein
LSNINVIVAVYRIGSSYAAKVCYDFVDSYMDYDDWYLPAKDQFAII